MWDMGIFPIHPRQESYLSDVGHGY